MQLLAKLAKAVWSDQQYSNEGFETNAWSPYKDGNYTFWDYMRGSYQKNHGLRIDHMLVSSSLIDLIKKIEIKKNIRSQLKPSDHVPLECTFI